MAAKKKAAAKKAPKASRKEVRENPGLGHNVNDLGKAAAPLVERFLALKKTQRSDMSGYAADFKTIYEEAANDLGLKQSVVAKELKRIDAKKLAEEKEKEMAADERQQTILFRQCFAGTPFEHLAAGDLAAPDEVEEANEEDHENAEGEE